MMQSAFSNYSNEASYDAYLNSSIARSDYSSGEYAQQSMQPCPCHECYASQSRTHQYGHGQVVRSYRHDPYQTAQAPVQYSPESRPALRKPNSPLPAGNMTPPPMPMPLGFPPMLHGMMVPPMPPAFPFAMPPMLPMAMPCAPTSRLPTPLSSNASDSQSQHEDQVVQGSPDMKARGSMVVSMAMLEDTVGRMAAIAKTPNGSSFLQAALRDRDPKAHELVLSELEPHFGALLLDTHGCYVVKGLLEQMPHDRVVACVNGFARDEDTLFHLCTDSLHTRRMVQFLLEFLSGNEVHFLSKLMKTRTAAVAKTQQGCIAMQRTMDRCTAIEREAIFECIRPHVVDFAVDPYANYVVQYMMEVGHKETISRMAVEAFSGRVANLACDKFASNVIEKCLFHVDSEAQHALLEEMYSVPEAQLAAMLDDNYGNYIVQSSIALATFRDVWMISEKLQPVLAKVPYGYKIESRLTRRLKGKTATGGPRGRA